MSSYDSSSASKQLDAAGAGSITPSQQQQGMGVRGGSSSTSVGGGSNAGTRNAEAAGLPPSDTPVSVTSITAAALDKHMQQQQAATITDSAALHQQQQQAHHPSSAERQGPDLLIQPSELQGHFILTGCGSSFLQFARQLAASASPAAEPLTVVLLHPEHPGALAVELNGQTMCFVSLSGPVASTGAVAARSGSACRYTSYFAGRLCTVSVERANQRIALVCVCACRCRDGDHPAHGGHGVSCGWSFVGCGSASCCRRQAGTFPCVRRSQRTACQPPGDGSIGRVWRPHFNASCARYLWL